MADLLDRIREELSTRLEELRPLVDEQRRLQAALLALGDGTDKARAVVPSGARTSPKRRGRKPTPAKPRRRAPRGANRQAVLRAVGDRSGATSAELAAVSGVDRNTVYGLLAQLVKDGDLQKRALPTGRTGYVLAEQQTEA